MECERLQSQDAGVDWIKACHYYFPDAELTAKDRRVILINQLLPFFSSEQGKRLLDCGGRYNGGAFTIELDFDNLCAESDSSDLPAAIEIQPLEGLTCIGAAIHAALMQQQEGNVQHRTSTLIGAEDVVNVRLFNYKQSAASIAHLKSSTIGNLVTIKGTVIRCGSVKPLVESVGFACPKCDTSQRLNLEAGAYAVPPGCDEGCRAKAFVLQRDSAILRDWQKLRIQEQKTAELAEESRAPRTIEVELTKDLAGFCTVGDEVEVLGIVKVTSTDAKKGGKQNERCLYLLYLEAVSIRKIHTQIDQPPDDAKETTQFSEPSKIGSILTNMDLHAIERFSQEALGLQFRQLLHSFCPSIFGNAMVKAGLLLALFGGTKQQADASPETKRRSSIHILMCGDPGLGKSQLLQAASAIAPRGLYICGTTSSSSGLTASVVRDTVSGEYMCEAGALVLADQGLCCIDEFDKLASEHQAILGAMEQQEVVVAKAGICATLPARTTVLAAANPAGGHFDQSKTVAENLKMSSAMLSRFDLSFLLSDKPDQAWDQHLSEHVIAAHSGRSGHPFKRQRVREQDRQDVWNTQGTQALACSAWLMDPEEDFDPVPPRFMQKYIAYARTHVHPTLSADAKQVLKAFYTELRDPARPEGKAVTIRQLESLIRMTEARARADLRAEASASDAQEIIGLMSHTLQNDPCTSNTAGQKTGRGRQAEAKRLLDGLARMISSEEHGEVSVSDIFGTADRLEINVPDLTALIEDLNEAGELLKRGGGKYSLRSHSSRASSRSYF